MPTTTKENRAKMAQMKGRKMRYTVVRTDQKEGLRILKFDNKRELRKWIKEVGIDTNANEVKAEDNIHSDALGNDCVIFPKDPLHLMVERTIGF